MWFSRWRLAISIAALLLIFGFVGVVESGTVVIDEILPYCIDETGASSIFHLFLCFFFDFFLTFFGFQKEEMMSGFLGKLARKEIFFFQTQSKQV